MSDTNINIIFQDGQGGGTVTEPEMPGGSEGTGEGGHTWH